MKKVLTIAAICSLLIISGLLIGCGDGDTEQQIRNEGDIAITVTDVTGAPIPGVLVQVRDTAGTGAFINVGTTDASGKQTFTGTAGTEYYFTFSKAGLTTQTDIQRTPLLSTTVDLNITMS